MTSRAQLRSKSKKPMAARAKAHDRRLLEQAAKETAEGKPPAAVLRDATARAEAALKMPIDTNAQAKVAVAAHGAAERHIRELRVPMTLNQLCTLLGRSIEPDDFAATALVSVADQIETLAAFIDNAPGFSSDAWRLFQNLAERTEYASKVATWLQSKRPADMPEVQL